MYNRFLYEHPHSYWLSIANKLLQHDVFVLKQIFKIHIFFILFYYINLTAQPTYFKQSVYGPA